MKFKAGDKVRINPHSKYYGSGIFNPANVIGEVVECEGAWGLISVRVCWEDTSARNTYFESDLDMVEEVLLDI